MPPTFWLRIDKLEAAPQHVRLVNGQWMPPRPLGSNTRRHGDTTGILFCHDETQKSTTVWEDDPPQNLALFKTVSLYHHSGQFYGVPYDATAKKVPGGENHDSDGDSDSDDDTTEDWHTISFTYPIFDPDPTYTSAITIAGDRDTLYVRKRGQEWVRRLFPVHMIPAQEYPAESGNIGGIVGDLGVFLGMLALSTRPNRVKAVLEHCLRGNPWRCHNRTVGEGWTNGRGVVVYVWTTSDQIGHLTQFEEGILGKFLY